MVTLKGKLLNVVSVIYAALGKNPIPSIRETNAFARCFYLEGLGVVRSNSV